MLYWSKAITHSLREAKNGHAHWSPSGGIIDKADAVAAHWQSENCGYQFCARLLLIATHCFVLTERFHFSNGCFQLHFNHATCAQNYVDVCVL